jgi:PilZ domain
MSANRRKFVRRTLSYSAKIVAKDGSWGRNCRVIDVSDGGAKLLIEQPIELPTDFVLALSMRGKAARFCHVVRCEGCEIGVEFRGRDSFKAADAAPRLVSG